MDNGVIDTRNEPCRSDHQLKEGQTMRREIEIWGASYDYEVGHTLCVNEGTC